MKRLIFPISKKFAELSGIPYSSKNNEEAEFPSRLKKERLKKGKEQGKKLSVEKAAEGIGIVKSTLSDYEKGNTLPNIETLVKIADYYGVPCDFLLCRTGSTEPGDVEIEKKTGLCDPVINSLIELKSIADSEKEESIRARIVLKTLNVFLTLITENSYEFFDPLVTAISTRENNADKIACMNNEKKTIEVTYADRILTDFSQWRIVKSCNDLITKTIDRLSTDESCLSYLSLIAEIQELRKRVLKEDPKNE